MRFKEFLSLDELAGHLGAVSQANSVMGAHRIEKRIHTPVRNKGTSVGRAMAAGKVTNPARPAMVVSPISPITHPSVLKTS